MKKVKCFIECCTFCFQPKVTYKSIIYSRKCVRIHVLNELIDVVTAMVATTAALVQVSSLFKEREKKRAIGEVYCVFKLNLCFSKRETKIEKEAECV